MKRLIALLLAMILCLSLEACGVKAELVPNAQETHIQVTPREETGETQTEIPSLQKKLPIPWKKPPKR